MCHAMPAQVIQIIEHGKAIVRIGGVEKEISTVLVEDIAVNDYVIIHVGFALTKLDEQAAVKTLTIFAEMCANGQKE